MPGLSALIVDDSIITRDIIAKVLRLSGLPLSKVHQAQQGGEGLQLLQGNDLDIVIVDLDMPVMDGQTMIKEIHSNEKLREIPVLLLAHEGRTPRIDALLKAGASAYLRKPFLPEDLRDAILPLLRPQP